MQRSRDGSNCHYGFVWHPKRFEALPQDAWVRLIAKDLRRGSTGPRRQLSDPMGIGHHTIVMILIGGSTLVGYGLSRIAEEPGSVTVWA
jgi:hypothetical protein